MPRVQLPQDLREAQVGIRNMQDRFSFYKTYFMYLYDNCSSHLVPEGLIDYSDSKHTSMSLIGPTTKITVMKGLITRYKDEATLSLAAGEAYTRALNKEPKGTMNHYRFFVASDCRIQFFRGKMKDGYWVCEGQWHPVQDADRVKSYIVDCMKKDGIWQKELRLERETATRG